MKTLRVAAGALLLSFTALLAQPPDTPAPSAAALPAPVSEAQSPAARLTDQQLDQLLGPIALYPDALIALILPATTQPADIVLAARYLNDRGADLSQVESRAWDESVKSLTHYPEVVKWLDENLTWTKQVGEAFAEQPADVMKAIQRLRAIARANGALADSPQQRVLVEPASVIRIVPAQPDVIYVPYYDPTIVYVSEPISYIPRHPFVTFGIGCRVGSWLCNDFNWIHCTLWVGDRHRHWDHRHDWHRPVVPVTSVTVVSTQSYASPRAPRQWTPPPRASRPAMFNHVATTVNASTANISPASPRTMPRPTYRTTPTMEIARPPTVVSPQPLLRNVTPATTTVATTPSPAPQVSSAPAGRIRSVDSPRPADRPRVYPPPPATVHQPAVPSTANTLPTAAPLHIVGGSRAQYPTVSPAPAPHVSAPAPAVYVPPPQSAPAPVVNSAPASTPGPANPPPQDPGDRRHRDRRNID